MGLILKANYRLHVDSNNNGYIQSAIHSLPITAKTAMFLSLLNGSRSVEEVVDIFINAGLFKAERALFYADYITQRYATLLEEDCKSDNNPNRSYDPKDFVHVKAPIGEDVSMSFPTALMYVVTNNCDKSCIYCYMDARNRNLEADALTFDELTELLTEAAAMGVSHLAFTGGEPFIRKDLTQVISHTSKLGMTSNVITKFNLSDQQLNDLTGLQNFTLHLSFDTHVNEIASYLTGTKNQSILMDNLVSKILARDIELVIAPVVNGLTYPHFNDFLQYLQALGVKHIALSRYADSLGRNDGELIVSDEQWENVLSHCRNYPSIDISVRNYNCNPITGEETESIDDYVCKNGRYGMVLTHDGKAIFCEQVPDPMEFCYGDYRKNSLIDIWQSDERKNILFPVRSKYVGSDCHECEAFDTCLLKRSCLKTSIMESNTAYAPCSYVRESCGFKQRVGNTV